jgi:hypothetical protein
MLRSAAAIAFCRCSALTLTIPARRKRTSVIHGLCVAAGRNDSFAANRERLDLAAAASERRDLGVVHDQAQRCVASARLAPAAGGRIGCRQHRGDAGDQDFGCFCY